MKTANTEHRQRKREEIDVSLYRLCDSDDEEVGKRETVGFRLGKGRVIRYDEPNS